MRSFLAFLLLFTASVGSALVENANRTSLDGFSERGARQERVWEQNFMAIPSTAILRSDMERLSLHPHHLGSPYDKKNAEWILSQFRSWGVQASLEEFDVLMPTPRVRKVELISPTHFVARLQEPVVPGDSTSTYKSEELPPYNAYSIDGDVTAPLVYVNFGVPADYAELDRLGISVKGAIVIARLGNSWRGVKPKVAAEHGAVGCILYSDPMEDGFNNGDTFPKGPYRPRDGAERGSVMDMPLYPGDPLTPGIGAVPGAKRLPLREARTLTKIPVLPISYGDAQPLLAALTGPVSPRSWHGGLPLPYHIGPGPAKVHLKVAFNWQIKRLYDIIVKIPGSEFPDEWIMRGNHYDAWVYGAEDPISGTDAVMEEVRGCATLLKQGWRPKRTIIYAVWDGEEEGMLGSTEWVEEHADELRNNGVIYINSDMNNRGFLFASGSHSLEHFINQVAKDVPDPETNLSVWKRLQLKDIARANAQEGKELMTRPDIPIRALGSGSDYAAFIDHAGIASLNIGYAGEADGGVYHSAYDDFYWYTHFSDKSFVYGRALAQTAGIAVMRFADADLLPFEFTDQAETVAGYVKELETLLKSEQEGAKQINSELSDGVFAAAMDPQNPVLLPKPVASPPALDFTPLNQGVTLLQHSADRYKKALAHAASSMPTGQAAEAINQLLIETERSLLLDEGLPNRPWYKHQLYAPGFYTGYGVKTIPAVRESIEQSDWSQASASIANVGDALRKEASVIDRASAQLEQQ